MYEYQVPPLPAVRRFHAVSDEPRCLKDSEEAGVTSANLLYCDIINSSRRDYWCASGRLDSDKRQSQPLRRVCCINASST